MTNWRKFKQLNRTERLVFYQALLLLPVAAVVLRFPGVRYSRKFFSWLSAGKCSNGYAGQEQANRIAWLVHAAARHGIYKAGCLQRSFILWLLLRRRGIAAEVRIGVRKEGNRVRAHAWVEYAGIALNEHAEIASEFSPFAFGLIAEKSR